MAAALELAANLPYAADPRAAADRAADLERAGLDTRIRDLARPRIALYVGGMGARGKNFYNNIARAYGYRKEAALIQDLYLSGRKKEAEAAVPDEFVEQLTMVGPAGYVRERIEAFRAAGVTTLSVDPVGPEPARVVERIRAWV